MNYNCCLPRVRVFRLLLVQRRSYPPSKLNRPSSLSIRVSMRTKASASLSSKSTKISTHTNLRVDYRLRGQIWVYHNLRPFKVFGQRQPVQPYGLPNSITCMYLSPRMNHIQPIVDITLTLPTMSCKGFNKTHCRETSCHQHCQQLTKCFKRPFNDKPLASLWAQSTLSRIVLQAQQKRERKSGTCSTTNSRQINNRQIINHLTLMGQ